VAMVQTNETSRGLCWLLPTLYVPWTDIDLVDLGCSAGLNLVADLRHYALQGTEGSKEEFSLGRGEPPQFVVASKGVFVPPGQANIPHIHTRRGCDLHPFGLHNREDELTLASFIWGDQVQRMARLQEGIAAFHQVQKNGVPVQLSAVDIPFELPHYLHRSFPDPSPVPVVLYNTYLRPYLHDKGVSLGTVIGDWAKTRTQPVLWLQWELLKQEEGTPPALGWLGWTAELWQKGQHRKWHLGWVHPHGGEVRWLRGFSDWAGFFRGYRGLV